MLDLAELVLDAASHRLVIAGLIEADAADALVWLNREGFAGSLLGVDLHKVSKVNSAGGNRHGAMFGAGALGMRIGIVEDIITLDDRLVVVGAGTAISGPMLERLHNFARLKGIREPIIIKRPDLAESEFDD